MFVAQDWQNQQKDQQDQLLLIGQLAKESGIPIKTIRYYEEMGLLISSGRTEGKYRLFKPDAIARLAFIKTLQRLGLSLQEILEVLKVYDGGQLPCDDIKQKLETQLAEIDRHLLEIMALRNKVSGLLASWQLDAANLENDDNGERSTEICSILHKNLSP